MRFVVASATALATLVTAASASGQELGAGPESSAGGKAELLEAQGAQDRRTFDIPAQPLSGALNAFGRQSGLQVTIDLSLAAGVQSQAVSGSMTSAEALNQLLAGTGITGRFTGKPHRRADEAVERRRTGRRATRPGAGAGLSRAAAGDDRQLAAALRGRPGGDGRAARHPRQSRRHGYAVQPDELHVQADPGSAGPDHRRGRQERSIRAGHGLAVVRPGDRSASAASTSATPTSCSPAWPT